MLSVKVRSGKYAGKFGKVACWIANDSVAIVTDLSSSSSSNNDNNNCEEVLMKSSNLELLVANVTAASKETSSTATTDQAATAKTTPRRRPRANSSSSTSSTGNSNSKRRKTVTDKQQDDASKYSKCLKLIEDVTILSREELFYHNTLCVGLIQQKQGVNAKELSSSVSKVMQVEYALKKRTLEGIQLCKGVKIQNLKKILLQIIRRQGAGKTLSFKELIIKSFPSTDPNNVEGWLEELLRELIDEYNRNIEDTIIVID